MSHTLRHNRNQSIIPQPSYESTPIRFTRRGKIFLGLSAIVLTGVAITGVANVVDAASPDYAYSDTTVTTVADRGDTIWGIAQEIEGINQIDIRDAVQHLQDTNSNLNDGLQEGEAVVRPESIVVKAE